MLKKIRGLFLGLVVLAGSACVTPTHASSALSSHVIFTYIQASGPTGAKEELIVVHNNTANPIDITDWCLVNKVAVKFACFSIIPGDPPAKYTLPPYGYATVVSEEYTIAHGTSVNMYSVGYHVTNQSSGSLVASADSLSLVDPVGSVIDTYAWGASAPNGKAWSRVQLLSQPDIFATNNTDMDWAIVSIKLPPDSSLLTDFLDVPPVEPIDETNIDDGSDVINAPENNQQPINATDGGTAPIVMISELLPNPAGSDSGTEFIELFNPSNEPQLLDGVEIRIGIDTVKTYAIPSGTIMAPGEYRAFTNQQLSFTLVNTHGFVQLFYNGAPLGQSIEYSSPKDGQAWALIASTWQYTTLPTPNEENQASLVTPSVIGTKGTDNGGNTNPKPCAANQFRNPETGRCKLLSSTVTSTSLVPCKPGQERNPETNRCRTIQTSSNTLTACKPGQERNPETNRCRNVPKMTHADYAVKGVQEKADAQLSWYYWLAIGVVVLLILGYATWEWRSELKHLWETVKRRTFAKRGD